MNLWSGQRKMPTKRRKVNLVRFLLFLLMKLVAAFYSCDLVKSKMFQDIAKNWKIAFFKCRFGVVRWLIRKDAKIEWAKLTVCNENQSKFSWIFFEWSCCVLWSSPPPSLSSSLLCCRQIKSNWRATHTHSYRYKYAILNGHKYPQRKKKKKTCQRWRRLTTKPSPNENCINMYKK